MVWDLSSYELYDLVSKQRPEALVRRMDPTKDTCPHCGEKRKIKWTNPVGPNGKKHPKPTFPEGKPMCSCEETQIKEMIDEGELDLKEFLRPLAIEKNLPNGEALHIDIDGHRDRNLIGFWHVKTQQFIEPDSNLAGGEGAVPFDFLVGDGDFDPDFWDGAFDMGYTSAYPNLKLILEMKQYFEANPEKTKMVVEINGTPYRVSYDPEELDGKWESCVLFIGRSIKVTDGEPRWRRAADDNRARPEAEAYVREKEMMRAEAKREEEEARAGAKRAANRSNAKNRNGALMGLVAQHLNGKNNNGVLEAEINRAKSGAGRTRRNRKLKRGTRRR
uniref:Uncharacterized protein n=1 Tax=viral metagenome TaxID=1070528 RepID=A0A6C0DRK9_9ZZZZ